MSKRKKSGAESPECVCGRKRSDAAIYVHQSYSTVYVYHRCECGSEWTESRSKVDRSQPITTDEVLEVYQRLEAFEGSLSDLLQPIAEQKPEPKPDK
ncbi:MAG: hypothetical protein E6I70_06585 [Chloroflexi bacterium]|nr:MAG: hypothetical protein E6I63_07935 [Chloroflexota bacterium]TME18717.1 MAG: hypothetical protein E6I70_06585 [Chloroflexota bacterium]